MHAPMVALLALVAWIRADADRELAAWAVLRGVSPHVALAVAETETGNVPPARRDAVVSRGNVGRLQVNATTWCPVLGLPRAECIRALQQRTANIAVGTAILARQKLLYAVAPGANGAHLCKCGRRHAGGWTGHYNAGPVVHKGSRGERYGLKVVGKIRDASRTGRRW